MKELLVLIVVALVSCETPLPVVKNRNVSGRYVTPACPVCGLMPEYTTTVYIDAAQHVYQAEWQ